MLVPWLRDAGCPLPGWGRKFILGNTQGMALKIKQLVGGLEHEFYDFLFSWECHHPN